MNEPTLRLDSRPDIASFVQRVRDRLADLGEEEREELVGGLEADLHELVADGGSVSELGDPRAYADELRAAAGVPRVSTQPPRRTVGEALHAFLDVAHARWHELMGAQVVREPWAVVSALRPAWWVLRAWVAIQLLALFTGHDLMLFPELGGQPVGLVVLAVATLTSVQLGRGKLWLSSDRERPVVGRVGLLLLNVFAVAMTWLVLSSFDSSARTIVIRQDAATAPGLHSGGAPVENLYPYDADGRPLQGVQLFDQDGNPVTVAAEARVHWDESAVLVAYPWLNGAQRLYNVFPLPVRTQEEDERVLPTAWESATPPVLPAHPLAAVPPAALPGADQPVRERSDEQGDKQADSAERRTR